MNRQSAFVMLAIGIVAVACDKERGGGGTPTGSCGLGAAGAACTTNEDCLCAYRCVTSQCLQIVQPIDENVNVPPPTPIMTRLCRKVGNLPCRGNFDLMECEQELAGQREELAMSPCVATFDRYLTCLDNATLRCTSNGDDIEMPAGCSDVIAEFLRCEPCGVTGGGCVLKPAPPQPAPDAGTSTTTSTCEVSATMDSCDGTPDLRGEMSCRPEGSGASQIWVCTCDKGTRVGNVIGVASANASCCGFDTLIETHCGLVEDSR